MTRDHLKGKNDFAKQIGQRIKEIRKEADLTLKELARDTGLSSSTWPIKPLTENGGRK